MFCQGFVKEWLMEKSFQLIIALTHYREIHPPPLRHKKSGLQALRRETHRPYLFRKILYYQRLEHEEHEKKLLHHKFRERK